MKAYQELSREELLSLEGIRGEKGKGFEARHVQGEALRGAAGYGNGYF